MPDGGFGMYVGSVDGSTFVAERSVYDAATFELGSSETGSPITASKWRFAVGAVSGFWDTYFLILNPSWSTSVSVTLTFRRTDGQPPVTHTVVVPARMRIAVNPSSLMPGASTTYATEVEAASGGQIVVERAMYWPGWPNWLGSHVSLGRPQ
jgi:hypothetical protein